MGQASLGQYGIQSAMIDGFDPILNLNILLKEIGIAREAPRSFTQLFFLGLRQRARKPMPIH